MECGADGRHPIPTARPRTSANVKDGGAQPRPPRAQSNEMGCGKLPLKFAELSQFNQSVT